MTPIPYSGVVWCVKVPTGAFVARRGGKVFVTGNSGFPKSLDVSKAFDKAAGAEREVVAPDPQAAKRNRSTPQFGGQSMNEYDPGWDGPLGRMAITAPATDLAKRWDGWGTALKPAFEPVILARKPLVGTVAANVERYGVGGLNIDGCRVQVFDAAYAKNCSGDRGHAHNRTRDMEFGMGCGSASELGRWPANVILDEAAGAALDSASDGSEPSRFFYCAKASGSERTHGGRVENKHPTVKPIALMRYLVRLVTPPGGMVLDPFCGSGTTGGAAVLEGMRFVGCEKEDASAETARQRIVLYAADAAAGRAEPKAKKVKSVSKPKPAKPEVTAPRTLMDLLSGGE